LTFPITITATSGDHSQAETPAGPVEAGSLREMGCWDSLLSINRA
jgi:hypothetical protein